MSMSLKDGSLIGIRGLAGVDCSIADDTDA